MVSHDEISDYISELISRGYSSLARDDGSRNLENFQKIAKGLNYLKANEIILSVDISKCIVVLKLLVELRDKIIRSKKVLDHQVPNIYKSVDSLNELFVKSANQVIKSDEQETITQQCEEFLKAADELRKDPQLKSLGVLDGNLKNVIGRLRKKASIDSVFEDDRFKVYDEMSSHANMVLESSDPEGIGIELKKLTSKLETLDGQDPNRKRLILFIQRYEKAFIKKIKKHVNFLIQESKDSSLFDVSDLLDQMVKLEQLIEYHKNKGLNIFIRNQKKRLESERFHPILNHLTETKEYVLCGYQNPSWLAYEAIYMEQYHENELFSDTFYEYTLKGLKPKEVHELLEQKKDNLKKLNIQDLKYVPFEQEFETRIDSLLQTFESHPGQFRSSK